MEHSKEDAIYRALCKEIKLLMLEKELRQVDVADEVGVRRETFGGYLSGSTKKGMPTTVLIAVAGILGTDLADLSRRAIERAAKEG